MQRIRYIQAVLDAQREEMARDPSIFVIGEDVRHALMGTTAGLVDTFGEDRVVDAPISEAGFTGLAIGAAMAGLRPLVEYQINTLQYVAMDQLVNQMARLRYMTGGQLKIPLTIRVRGSGAGFMAAQHSDSTWAQLLHVGIKVAVPATPFDVKGLIKAAVRQDDPVILYEPRQCYSMRGEVPDTDYVVPLGQGAVRRAGSDATVVATGHLVQEALKAADSLASRGIEVEVIDPRTLYPLDEGLILESVRKTGRLVVADDGYRICGFAAEVAAIVVQEAFGSLKAPVRRVTRPQVPVPYSPALLREVSPGAEQIAAAVESVVAEDYESKGWMEAHGGRQDAPSRGSHD